MNTLAVLLGILCCALATYLIITIVNSSKINLDRARLLERLNLSDQTIAQLRSQLSTSEAKTDELNRKNAGLTESVIHLKAEIDKAAHSYDQLALSHARELAGLKEQHEDILKQSENRFKVMATEIMERQSSTLRQQNEERIGAMLNPLKENIELFRKEVNTCYNAEARERNTLQEKIKELIQTNDNIGKEARELANALKGNSKKQGDWGEMILESILENSGLRKGEEFEVQKQTDDDGSTLRDEYGHSLRPDVIVNYPGAGGKKMVIDSKVSLTAFVDYANSDDPDEQERLGKLHLASVIKHINELSEKKYQDYIGTQRLDFVMMFIPNEAAYAAAMSLDPTLWQKAYDKRVLMVSPTQLVGSLRLIKQLWNTERQTANALEIATRSGQLYDKFVGFISDMEKLKKGLDSATSAFDGAINKLSQGKGNLVSRAESLRQLGIKASKNIPKTYTDNNDDIPDRITSADNQSSDDTTPER